MNKRNGSLALLLAAGTLVSLNLAMARPQTEGKMDSKPQSTTTVPATDKQFAMKAAQGGIAEVQAGKLAAAKATSDAWKQYGQKMVEDHTAANDKLKTIATDKGITLPTSPAPKDAAAIAKMSKLSGTAFNAAYKKFAMASHIEAEKLFTTEAQTGKDAELNQFAKDTLPTIKQHHMEANKMAGKMSSRRMSH